MPTYWLFSHYVAIGGNMAIRKQILTDIMGFDPSIPFYGDDAAIAKKVYDKGWKVKFSLKFKVLSSGRRYIKQGVFKTIWLYIINYLYIKFSGTARDITAKEIR